MTFSLKTSSESNYFSLSSQIQYMVRRDAADMYVFHIFYSVVVIVVVLCVKIGIILDYLTSFLVFFFNCMFYQLLHVQHGCSSAQSWRVFHNHNQYLMHWL